MTGDKVELFRYTMAKALWEPSFTEGFSLPVKLEAIQWFNAERNRLRKLSLRGLQSALIRINVADNEAEKQDALGLLLFREPVRDIPGFDFAEIAEAVAKQEAHPERLPPPPSDA